MYLTDYDLSSWLEERVRNEESFQHRDEIISLVTGRLDWSYGAKLDWKSHEGRSAAKAWSKISKWHECTVDLLSLQHIGVCD